MRYKVHLQRIWIAIIFVVTVSSPEHHSLLVNFLTFILLICQVSKVKVIWTDVESEDSEVLWIFKHCDILIASTNGPSSAHTRLERLLPTSRGIAGIGVGSKAMVAGVVCLANSATTTAKLIIICSSISALLNFFEVCEQAIQLQYSVRKLSVQNGLIYTSK